MLQIKKKHLDRREWFRDTDYTFSCLYHIDEAFQGSIGCITFTNLDQPMFVDTKDGHLCIADNGYQWLEFVPENGHYALTVMICAGKIFQYYFDITQKNEVTKNGDAVFYDLFLDVVSSVDGKPALVDEDELQIAFQTGIISQAEYNLAQVTASGILSYCTDNKDDFYQSIYKYLSLF